jgi:hypothetical protein
MNEGSRWASEWDNVTTLSPASAVALAVGTIAIFSVPRRFVFLPLLLVTSFVPISERLVILGMDFAFLRLMVVLCWARFLVRGEHSGFKWNRIDMVFAAWIAWRMLATLVRTGSLGSLVRHAGLSIDALGIYFLMRVLIRSWRDLDTIILTFAFVAIPVALSMTYETSTGWNFSSVFSDHLEGVAMSRGGAVRARIGYAHPLIAGAIWASVVPLLAARWWKPGSSRAFTFLSVVAAITCVWASSSSTPLLGLLIALVAAGAWVVRRHMNWVRWAILGALILLQLGMEKPIWHLFQRVTAIGISGSTGYHRYRLFDAFVRHFSDWALIGVGSTAYWGRQLDDVTNVFIIQAVSGGLVGISALIAMFVMLFRRNGRLLRLYRGSPQEIYLWAMGVCLFTHLAMMNAMAYSWQMQLPWFACFAMVASVPPPQRAARRRRSASQPERVEVRAGEGRQSYGSPGSAPA